MPATLAEDARQYLKAQGAPISEFNIKNAMEELRREPNLRPSYSSDNQMVANMGGSTGVPDKSRVPGQGREFSDLKGAGGFGVYDPSYVPSEGSWSSSSQMTAGPAQGQGGNANQSRKGQGGNAGGAPTTTNRPGGVATDNNTSETAPIPKVTATDITSSEVNQLARPKPAAMGARPGGDEVAAARAPVPKPRPPASPGVTAPDPANTPVAQGGPQPSVPVPPSTGALPAPTGVPRLSPTTPPDWPGSTRWAGPTHTLPIPGAPAPNMIAGGPLAPSINPAIAASPLVQSATMPLPPPPGGFPPPPPPAPGMMSGIGGMISSVLGGLPTIPPPGPAVGGGPIPPVGSSPMPIGGAAPPAPPPVPSDIGALLNAIPSPQSMSAAPPAPRLPPIPQGMTMGDTAAMSGGGVQGKPAPAPPPRRGSLRRKKTTKGDQK